MDQLIPTYPIVSSSVTIWNEKEANMFYRNGFYGKHLGLRKANPESYIDRPLTLSLFDIIYLQENLKIQITREGKILSTKKLMNYAVEHYEDFEEKYFVYKELRDLGYIVKPGMKFGTDFIVYEKGPGIDHSKWAVLVEKDSVKLRAINIVRAGRLAHSVKKDFLIAIASDASHRYFSFSRFKL